MESYNITDKEKAQIAYNDNQVRFAGKNLKEKIQEEQKEYQEAMERRKRKVKPIIRTTVFMNHLCLEVEEDEITEEMIDKETEWGVNFNK